MYHQKYRSGFALPTVIIASVVMIIVLLAALVGVVSVSSATKNQLYQRFAKEAAEAGVVAMRECMGSINATVASERDSLNGLAPDWRSCQNSTSLGGSSKYLQSAARYRSTFTVTNVSYQGGYYNFLSTGTVERITAGGAVRDTYEYPMRFRIKGQSLFPSKPATGNAFVCALLSQKTWCWGTNSNAEHGNGATGGSRLPSQTIRNHSGTVNYAGVTYSRSLKKADIDIAGGDNFACNITTNHPPANHETPQTNTSSNAVYCWGSQQEGQLGNRVNSTNSLTVPVPVYPRWGSQDPIQIATGASHACVLTNQTSGGNLWCWGKNNQGQLGRNNTNSPSLDAYKVYAPNGNSAGGNFKYVTASNANTCAIGGGSNSQVFCWGDNKWGQTGTHNGTDNNVLLPSRVIMYPSNDALEATQVSIAARGPDASAPEGGGHGCAISTGGAPTTDDREGEIWCWGKRDYGAMGISMNPGSSVRANDITSIDGSSTYYADSISTSWRATCALVRLGGKSAPLSSRRIYCWGSNINGELGINRPPSVTINGRSPLDYTATSQRIWIDPDISSRDHFEEADVTELTQGGISFRFCAIAGAHNYCWGRNDVGQVGDGTEAGDFTSDPKSPANNRHYPRLSIFAEPVDKGLIY